MLGIVPNRPTRIVTKGLIRLRPLCLALVPAFVLFTASAHADNHAVSANRPAQPVSLDPRRSKFRATGS